MSIEQVVTEKELAPGIIVYSHEDTRFEQWLSILKLYSEPLLDYGSVTAKNENGYYSAVSLDHRKCKMFSGGELFDCHAEDPLRLFSDEVENFMSENVKKFCLRYNAHEVKKNHDIIFLRYGDGDFFKNHNDDCPAYHRTVSSTIYFNNDYDGGELCFKHFNIEYKPKQGDCVVFSSAFPYMHSVKPIANGIRYAAVNWYKYI